MLDSGAGWLGSTKMQRGFWWLSEIISSCILKPNRSNFSPEDNFVWQLDCENLVYLCSHFQVGYKKRLCELFSSKLHSVGLTGDNINMYVQSLELYNVLAKIVVCGAGMRKVGRNKKLEVLCVLLSNPGGACPVAERASALWNACSQSVDVSGFFFPSFSFTSGKWLVSELIFLWPLFQQGLLVDLYSMCLLIFPV